MGKSTLREAFYYMPVWLKVAAVLESMSVLLMPLTIYASVFALDRHDGCVGTYAAMFFIAFVVPAIPLLLALSGIWLYGRYRKWQISVIPISIPVIGFMWLLCTL